MLLRNRAGKSRAKERVRVVDGALCNIGGDTLARHCVGAHVNGGDCERGRFEIRLIAGPWGPRPTYSYCSASERTSGAAVTRLLSFTPSTPFTRFTCPHLHTLAHLAALTLPLIAFQLALFYF